MRRARAVRRGVAGATLIEAMIAIGVLGIGTAGIAQLVQSITSANERSEYQNRALEVYAAFATDVNNAACDVRPEDDEPRFGSNADPGLKPRADDKWQDVPVEGSFIRLVGDIDAKTRVWYKVRLDVPKKGESGFSSAQPPSYAIVVRIQELDARFDPDAPSPTHVREYPLSKVCNFTAGEERSRGGW